MLLCFANWMLHRGRIFCPLTRLKINQCILECPIKQSHLSISRAISRLSRDNMHTYLDMVFGSLCMIIDYTYKGIINIVLGNI